MSNVGDTNAAPAAPGQFKPLLPERSPLTMIAKGLEYETQATLKVKIPPSIPTTIPLSFPSEFNCSPESTSHPEPLSQCSNTKKQALPHLFNGSLFGCVFYITPAAKPQVSTNSSAHSYPTHPNPILTIASTPVLVADPPASSVQWFTVWLRLLHYTSCQASGLYQFFRSLIPQLILTLF
jgi:hypothetical protein